MKKTDYRVERDSIGVKDIPEDVYYGVQSLRAARNTEGHVIMYADRITDSMDKAITETNRRRAIQQDYNEAHGITPKTIQKAVRDLISISEAADKSEDNFVKDAESMSYKELNAANIRAGRNTRQSRPRTALLQVFREQLHISSE